MNRKHLFLLALALLCLVGVIHLQGCVGPEYRWTRTHEPSQDYLWRKVSRAEMYRICVFAPEQFRNLGACAFPWRICVIYSDRSEDEAARTISGDGDDLRTHELRHCSGFSHQGRE